MTKIHLLVELDVKPDQVGAFVKMFSAEFVSRSRDEDGCELYELWQNPENPEKMTIVETWSSQILLDRHMAQSWFAEWAPKMEIMQASPLIVRTLVSAKN